MQDLTNKAISVALEGKWEEAIELNLTLLKKDQNDIATLNRLGHAYTKLGEIAEANKTYKKVLSLDKYNPIASKGLKRLKTKQKAKTSETTIPAPAIKANFIEEPGKTKTTQLVRLADNETIANLHIGQPVFLDAKKRSVTVKTEDGTYIGSLPDDLSFRLGKLLRGGNKYETLIKGLEGNAVLIFIREVERSKRHKNTPSFPSTTTSSYYADVRPAVIKEEPIDTRETGEEEAK
jgi:tetratricopeptide (TPR) repeat protein